MAKMFLMCGNCAAGKTYFAKDFAGKNRYIYLSIDKLYEQFNGDEKNREGKFEIWQNFYKMIHYYETFKYDIVVDTNAPTLFDRTEFLNWFPYYEHHLIWINASHDLCLENNRNRDRVIPENIMKELFSHFEEPTMFTYTMSCKARSEWKSVSMIKNENNYFKDRITLFGKFPKEIIE